MKRVPMAAVLLNVALLGGCGDDVSGPSRIPPAPNVAGNYFGGWTIQVVRTSDNFTTSFFCSGSFTITQTGGTNGVGSLSGFAVVGTPCPPLSFPLSGIVRGDGTISFTTGGPRPPQGPCPPTLDAEYTGLGNPSLISVRAAATVQCPEFGEHRFAYIISARRSL